MKIYYYLISIFCKHSHLIDTYKVKCKYIIYKGKYRPRFYIYVTIECECCKKQLGSKIKIKSNQSEYQVKQFFNNLKDEEIH